MAAHAPHIPSASSTTPTTPSASATRVARPPRVQPPALDGYPDLPLFNTKAVVRQTGAPAPTLRAWERRYGILTPRRGQNGYRLYSERDIAIVAWLRERVDAGLTISQAIALLRSLDSRESRLTRTPHHPATPQRTASEPVATPGPAERADSLAFEQLTDALVDSFLALDEAGAAQVSARALAIHGVENVCLRLFSPTLARLGEQWRAGATTIAVEHFATSAIRAQLDALYRASLAGQSGPLALVGCAPGEAHELGALTLALFLRRAGLRVMYLGQSVEMDGLLSVARATRASWALLSATTRESAETLLAALDQLGRGARPPLGKTAVIAGGPAFACDPNLARRAGGFWLAGDATHVVEALYAGQGPRA